VRASGLTVNDAISWQRNCAEGGENSGSIVGRGWNTLPQQDQKCGVVVRREVAWVLRSAQDDKALGMAGIKFARRGLD